MNEQKPNAVDLLSQINEFENTLAGLQKSVGDLKSKINRNREQYGDDVSNWPGL